MITIADAKKTIYNWIDKEMKGQVSKVIWRDQGAPRPPRPYVGLKIISGPTITGDDDQRESSPGIYTVVGQREMTVEIAVYGENSLDLCHKLEQSLQRGSVLDTFAASEVSVLRGTSTVNLTIPLDAQTFESRAQFEVVFGFVTGSTDEQGYIEDVSGTDTQGEQWLVES